MELQIQDLVQSIKKDGIERANQQAAAILAQAEQQAEAILADAKRQAEKTLAEAKSQVEVFQNSARLDAQQAKRDAVLAFRQEIQAEFEHLLAADVRKTLNETALAALIQAALKGENPADYTVEVSEVSQTLNSQLAEALRSGLEIRPSKKVRAGFRLAAKDGSGYFDCSDEEISRMLTPFFRDAHL